MDVAKEYRDRYFCLVGPYMVNNAAFASMMRSTGSVISGSTAYHFIFPYSVDPNTHCKAHDLDIYIRQKCVVEAISHRITVQGYTVTKGPYMLMSNENPNPHGNEYSRLHGILSVNKFSKGDLRIDVISADNNFSLLLPIFYFHSTIVMNVLTPNRFISFYLTLSLNSKALIHHHSYENHHVFRSQSTGTLETRSMLAILKYMTAGIKIEVDPCSLHRDHVANCVRRRCCRLQKYTNDRNILHLTFSSDCLVALSPNPLIPLASWSLGGYECGRGPRDGLYKAIRICLV